MRASYALKRVLPKRTVFTKLIDRYSFARDAGFYRMLPRMVIKARTVGDISTIFQIANQHHRKVVFRAGGTSLSGQSVGDDILVEIKQGWRDVQVLNEGKQIKLQPGVVAAKANQHLEPFGYRIGPDPGSIRSAMIGGIVANNASGIGSGNRYNSYQTIAAMELVLPHGLVLNTADPHVNEKLHGKAPEVYTELLKIRDKIRTNAHLKRKIEHKYRLKNTMGYSLNSFLDYDEPIDILAHLMVGSEGTLGFISSVTFNTVPLQAFRATSFLKLPTLKQAARLIPALKKCKPYALEIMDTAALRAVQHIPEISELLNGELTEESAGLLVEFQAQDEKNLALQVESAEAVLKEYNPDHRHKFYYDKPSCEKLWKARRELGPLHAATRRPGTILVSEDVCFKIKDLAKAVMDLQNLFKVYHYDDAVIFGHAGDGNLHFKLSIDFSQKEAVETYDKFIEKIVDLVIDKYDGSLKAEHGTGRNMAPFVEREWGREAYQIMKDIKRLLDPSGILNPGVLISGDRHIHLKNIKPIPLVNPLIDQCIECGLCEPTCPSADLTLSARQRIAVLRELDQLGKDAASRSAYRSVWKHYQFEGVQSCAIDGLCALSCPIEINTGTLMKDLRANQQGAMFKWLAGVLEQNISLTVGGIRAALRVFTPFRFLLGYKPIYRMVKHLSRITGGRIPTLNKYLKAGYKLPKLGTVDKNVDVIYYPSCINRGLSNTDRSNLSPMEAFQRLLSVAGITFAYPREVENLCCGLAFSSKGYPDTALQAAIKTTESLWISSQGGKIPIVMDTSPCSNHMKHYDKILSGIYLAKWREMMILDMVEYIHDQVLDRVDIVKTQKKVVLHPTCSTRSMGIENKMKAIALRCSEEVVIPIDLACCAFAGDRGMKIPGLTESATVREAQEVREVNGSGHYSTSRTCEIGMSLATEKSYQALVYLVHDSAKERVNESKR
ncbi:MAG: FAD-binding oxidoreductase [Candidatus Marinimicrobia bacterium]|nr:FAD-binding oxidoreductase [Candidatus Neomarinimicrobiota bacterium]